MLASGVNGMAHLRAATCCAFVLAVGCYSGASSSNTGDDADAGSVDDDAGSVDDGGSSDGGEPSGPCGTAVPGPAPIRRLTAFEYDNTIADLLGDTSKPAQDFPEEGGSGFDNNADVASVSRLHAEKYMRAAED